LAHAMFEAVGQKGVIEYVEMPVELRKNYQYFTQADMTKARDAGCDVKFRPLQAAVKDYAAYLADSSYL